MKKILLINLAATVLVGCNPVSYLNSYMGWPDDNRYEEAAEYLLDLPDITPDSPEDGN